MYAWWHGKTAWFLTRHPNFRGPGFARFSRHVNLQFRLLALKDPDLPIDEVVRMAADPSTRAAALRDTRVPIADLQNALLEDSTALADAGNPRLPAAVTHALLDPADVPPDPHALGATCSNYRGGTTT